MPVYEYLCEKCEHEFEREQRISDDPIKTCPKCKARQARRLISRTSFVLKGGGWYSDLYSSPGKSDTGGDKDAGKSSGSESKPASKKEPAKGGGGKSKGSKSGPKGTKAA